MNSHWQQVQAYLDHLGEAFYTIKEYKMSHGVLHLLLTDERFVVKGQVVMSDCFEISGLTSSLRPCRFRVSSEIEGEEEIVVLRSEPQVFVAKALRVHTTDKEWRPKLGL